MSPSCDEKENLEQFVSSGCWWSIQRSDIAILSMPSPILLIGLKPSFSYGVLVYAHFRLELRRDIRLPTYKEQYINQLNVILKLIC